jgi:hypothetical protein
MTRRPCRVQRALALRSEIRHRRARDLRRTLAHVERELSPGRRETTRWGPRQNRYLIPTPTTFEWFGASAPQKPDR